MTTAPPPLPLNAWLRYDIVDRFLDLAAGGRNAPLGNVLEIGTGQGAVGARLARRGRYTGVELDEASAAVARARVGAASSSARLLVRELDDVLPAGDVFDLVCAFEVLEHTADDVLMLRRWCARVRLGGHLLLSVPAFAARYGPWDELVGHYRRYEPHALARLLTDAGLTVVEERCYGAGLGEVLEAVRNVVARRRGASPQPTPPGTTVADFAGRTAASGRQLQPRQALALATRAGTWPFRKAQRLAPHRGTGLVALARK